MANFTHTHKQQAIKEALAKHPRKSKETKGAYCARVATIAGCSAPYISHILLLQKYEQVGVELRAKEEAEAKLKPQLAIDAEGFGMGLIKAFHGWTDAFGKLGIVSQLYYNLAKQRGDVYAASFMSDIMDICERAQNRACMDKKPVIP